MRYLKRKDSCTFKREKTLDNQERIYSLLARCATRSAVTMPGIDSYQSIIKIG